ncbi:MAG: prepilin peptidase [bacterium]|nr:prepilin peptidase [bacterium]
MLTLSLVLSFLVGISIGSFLNVLVFRLGTGEKITGRSACLSCGRVLGPFELVPIFSFIFLRGRCFSCKSRLSWQYPLVELITGTLFAAILYKLAILGRVHTNELVFYWVITAILVSLAVYDLRHKILPDILNSAFIILSFAKPFVIFRESPFMLPHIASGFALSLPFFLVWYLTSGRWVGFGDVKLLLGMGFFLGIFGGIAAVIIGCWLGAIVGLTLILCSKLVKKYPLVFKSSFYSGFGSKSEIPFGPFLIFGLLMAFLFDVSIFNIVPWSGII